MVSFVLIVAAAMGHAEEVLLMLSASEGALALEPLHVGVQIFLGQSPRKAQEIMEVGEDVAQRIREQQRQFKWLWG